jgi:formylglycine-generating enzyme required for sulfatase activity
MGERALGERFTAFPRPVLWLVPGGGPAAGGGPARPIEPFYLSTLPVTNLQYEAFDPAFERSPASPGDRDPATGVSAHEAAEYCAWWAEVTRKPMRLPTAAEWEHACRGDSPGRWFWGDDPAAGDDYVWDADSSGAPPGRVGALDAKRSNPFGLYGMLGGVWEWVAAPGSAAAAAGDEGAGWVLCGGSFRTPRGALAVSLRREAAPASRLDDAGFRLARSLR